MQITNAKYIDPHPNKGQPRFIRATIDGVEMTVPLDTSNRHYDEILKQVDAATLTIADAD